jgi:hypothetical protein
MAEFTYSERNEDFTLLTWANGYGVWHAKATFTTPLGNTPEAIEISERALKKMKQAIRAEIVERMAPKKCRRLTYEVKANEVQPGSGRLMSLTISERAYV